MADNKYKHLDDAAKAYKNADAKEESMKLRHMEGLIHMAKKMGYTGKTDEKSLEKISDMFTDPNKAIEASDHLADFYAMKGYQETAKDFNQELSDEDAMKKIAQFKKDPNSTKHQTYANAFARTNHAEIGQIMKQFGKKFMEAYMQRVIPNKSSEYASESINQHHAKITKEDISEIIKRTGLEKHKDYVNLNKLSEEQAIDAFKQYHESGINEDWIKSTNLYDRSHEKKVIKAKRKTEEDKK